MTKSKKNPLKPKSKFSREENNPTKSKIEVEDKFDFGGLPKDRDLKKNIGCGG